MTNMSLPNEFLNKEVNIIFTDGTDQQKVRILSWSEHWIVFEDKADVHLVPWVRIDSIWTRKKEEVQG